MEIEQIKQNTPINTSTQSVTMVGQNIFLSNVFKKVSIGICISAAVSVLAEVLHITDMVNTQAGLYAFYGLLLVELGLVFYFSMRARKLSINTLNTIYFLYAALNGLTLSVVVSLYFASSVIGIFLGTIVLFYALSQYGLRTETDLTNYGKIALYGLLGLIVSSIINIFLGNGTFDIIISAAGIAIFVVLIAYDSQKMKHLYTESLMVESAEGKAELQNRYIAIGALELYLDFVNLFLKILSLFGKRK
jgi:FtsH-binding integral membrane protein